MNREWQPIETAPKDTSLLLSDPTEGMVVGFSCGVGWVYPVDDVLLVIMPTHWMPLPEPPQ